jgi:hypothetical protein
MLLKIKYNIALIYNMTNGNFYVGRGGFAYKKSSGAGGRRNQPLGLITGIPANVNNKYVPGSGVGASNIGTRRAAFIRATSCNSTQHCSRYFMQLGKYPILTPGHPFL